MADNTDSQRFDIARVVVLSGWSLTIAVCLCIIMASVMSLLWHPNETLAGPLKDWSGMCLGFLLGNFVNLVKDFITKS